MGIIPSRSLSEIAESSPISDKLNPLSLEQALRRYRNFANKKAYYVGPGYGDTVVFGLEGNANLIGVSKDVYEAIGSPNEYESIPVSRILKEAGYEL